MVLRELLVAQEPDLVLVHLLSTMTHGVTAVQLENFARCVHDVAPRLSQGFSQPQINQLVPMLFTVRPSLVLCGHHSRLPFIMTLCGMLSQGLADSQSVVRQWSVFALVQVCKSLNSDEILHGSWSGIALNAAQIKLVCHAHMHV